MPEPSYLDRVENMRALHVERIYEASQDVEFPDPIEMLDLSFGALRRELAGSAMNRLALSDANDILVARFQISPVDDMFAHLRGLRKLAHRFRGEHFQRRVDKSTYLWRHTHSIWTPAVTLEELIKTEI